MIRFRCLLVGLAFSLTAPSLVAADRAELQALLAREIIGPRQALIEVQDYLEPRIPRMPEIKTAAEWEAYANERRTAMLQQVVLRGEAARWRTSKLKVEWMETLQPGPGYRIRKLRYEALPGLWIPALLYEPEKLAGKVPVSLAVNGHDGNGKAAPYKQIRCINQARRGMLVLNVEWLGMGQLRTENYRHSRMNQIDLCGSSGLAPFYLCMEKGLDLLLAHPNADPQRVAVSGLSGGGWQTIYISSLDPRVKLSNPVAGYSSFLTRIRHHKDLGDSEQTPCDMATVADYNHLTAMMAPRATLLTYNSKDDCCFEAGYALPPLLKAASPIFRLYDREKALRSHVNDDPGTHNYEKDNRQAFYRMLGDHFFAGDKSFSAEEIPCKDEVKSRDDLAVELPAKNADFHSLAMSLAVNLPRDGDLPKTRAAAVSWQLNRGQKLREIVKAKDFSVQAEKKAEEKKGTLQATLWRLKLGKDWTVPAVELVQGEARGTVIVVSDSGRATVAPVVEPLLAAGKRVIAVDPFYFGEARIQSRDTLFALLVAAVGDRPLGLQASQVAAVARWAQNDRLAGPVTVVAIGPRSSLFALVAAGLDEKAIGGVELTGSLGSLKEVLEQNRGVDQMPEMFCFGLLESFDIRQMTALVAPRPVTFPDASSRVKAELAGLRSWYGLLGKEFDPVR